MAGTRYQYETSPRKLEPNYQEQKNKREKIHVVKDVPRQEVKISKAQKKKHRSYFSCIISFCFIVDHKL